ncbi:IclR family transcriptional regulator [Demequina sp. TTPB684]|uniref:IclR family transcriptional regulator n=1 Tax=unclassified Demequina TaxID=2620311 RepID=UPI001CF257C3|nr:MULTISPECIES: IclR family transcriptional regulator [unclassified Demequina]MCB2412022.1 IclR family transcriptional regulator [Demequina sp. TTPB684]UPU88811.1 IclR family transcriptional regulator [Demequina sp. TMPB413]
MDNHSGVGVVDKAAAILGALEQGPATLAELVETTHLARPTVHRIALALEHHHLVGRNPAGAFVLGQRFRQLAATVSEDRLVAAAQPVLTVLRDRTGESSQLYRLHGDQRICIAAADRPVGLRDSIPVGTAMTMHAGSAAQVLLAWADPETMHAGLEGARFTAADLAVVRAQGHAESAGEREPGVSSVSAPVWGAGGTVIAAVSISGPIERLTPHPAAAHAGPVKHAAQQLSQMLGNRER